MPSPKLIAPSILSADFGNLSAAIKAVDKAGADIIHIDVMDGHFVPNITVGPVVVKAARKATNLPLDVHLMIERPQDYARDFINAGADWISVHAEEGYHLDRTLSLIRECGAKVGIAVNPATPLSAVESALPLADFILIMTVNPGFGGQSFIPYCKDKIKALAETRRQRGLKFLIEVDGGVTVENIGELADLGVDIFVAGSAIFESADYKSSIAKMRKALS